MSRWNQSVCRIAQSGPVAPSHWPSGTRQSGFTEDGKSLHPGNELTVRCAPAAEVARQVFMEAAREVGIDRRNAIQASKVRIDPASRFGVISSGSSATFAQCPLYLVVDFATDLPTDESALIWPSLVKPSSPPC